jgi:pimeloyl-ACP methyl ester carboxylesterase
MPFVPVNGVQIYSEDSGRGEPLVLVHGSWDDHTAWDAVAPRLAESFRVVTYDRRGHGQSERPAAQGSRIEDEDDLAALIMALDCAPAHVAGNSFGASISLGLAARRPELFRTLTIHEPPLLGLIEQDPGSQELIRDVRASCQVVLDELARGEMVLGSRRFVEEVALGPGAWDQLPEADRDVMVHNAPTFLDEQRDPDWASMAESALQHINMPVLITRGDQSPAWFRPIIERLSRTLHGAEVCTLANAGHVPHVTHPDEYVMTLTRFIQT